ncbi:O-methyltransferase [Alicyclobacillus tolerans]|uniref:O-methyltransferase n=1 Tax=Alicyclobacillus tolerans TaxID=90970 RepID=UPI003B77962B
MDELLEELWRTGQDNDANPSLPRDELLMNITPDTGALLELLICSMGARRILELGTSDGYSTLWLTKAAGRTGGHVTTVEKSPKKTLLAKENFARVGLEQRVTFIESEIGSYLSRHETDTFDFIFLDADRENYLTYFDSLTRMLSPGGDMDNRQRIIPCTGNGAIHATYGGDILPEACYSCWQGRACGTKSQIMMRRAGCIRTEN